MTQYYFIFLFDVGSHENRGTFFLNVCWCSFYLLLFVSLIRTIWFEPVLKHKHCEMQSFFFGWPVGRSVFDWNAVNEGHNSVWAFTWFFAFSAKKLALQKWPCMEWYRDLCVRIKDKKERGWIKMSQMAWIDTIYNN